MKKLSFLLLFLGVFSCQEDTSYKTILSDPELYRSVTKQLTDVIIYDIFSPPVASRIYAYSSIAAYEAMLPAHADQYISLAGQLNGLEAVPQPETTENIDFYLASIHAYQIVGRAMIFSEEKMDEYREALYERFRKEGVPSSVMENSIAYGDKVAAHILSWADKDMYKQTRSFPKYTVKSETKYWKPTPPDYMEGIEPHWNKMRTMVLDSAGQFPPIPPLEVSLDKNSEFYRQLTEVFEVGRSLGEEETNIAKFWDCNPYVSHHRGHAMFATKKITPGGHWIGITAIATRQKGSSFDVTAEVYARVSIALFDAFISCWDEKWRSIVVRPETLINQYMDEEWVPLLQTPPFPEYTSGHSVISRAAAITLTDYFGDNFAFNDTTEQEYGLNPRDFTSFLKASEEAAISRLYGGIHYMMAIEN
ncbi:MAG: vanadium-dependent haloperoxidase, partial [Cyclobacteriaceae bacterium]|nr:vanadium-dependent haloperoxidase [Cyclobacteriaceae bacterium]